MTEQDHLYVLFDAPDNKEAASKIHEVLDFEVDIKKYQDVIGFGVGDEFNPKYIQADDIVNLEESLDDTEIIITPVVDHWRWWEGYDPDKY